MLTWTSWTETRLGEERSPSLQPWRDQGRAVHVVQDVVVFQLDTPDLLSLIYDKFPGVVDIYPARQDKKWAAHRPPTVFKSPYET